MNDDLAALVALGAAVDVPRLVAAAGTAVPGARHASLAEARADEHLHTVAASGDLAAQLDTVQFDTGEGPSVEVIEQGNLVRIDDLDVDLRWPAFARAALAQGVCAVLGLPVELPGAGRGALVLYAERAGAFTDAAVRAAVVLAAWLGTLVEAEQLRERATNLEVALETNRHIATAIGVVMARDLLTADAAFERLRDVSQRQQRKLRDIAAEVVRTGELPT